MARRSLLVGVFCLVVSLTHALVPPTFVTNATSKMAVCLDGSPAAYYHVEGFGDGVKNWMVYLMGGGWCNSNHTCQHRRNFLYGSSRSAKPKYFGGILSSNKDINPEFYDWNKVYVYYCDGSSFLGDIDVANLGSDLQLRGSRIFEAVIDEILAKGMKTATNALLAGGSAGGLATILHCDNFRARVGNASRVKCLSDSGFFIRAKHLPNEAQRESFFNSTITFHNLTSFLPTSCTSRVDPGLCFFSEYLVPYVQTPLFLLNSAFDRYQIQVNLKPSIGSGDEKGWTNCTTNLTLCTRSQRQLITDFRDAFLETLMDIGDNPSRGLFINACYGHVFVEYDKFFKSGGLPPLGNMTISQAIGDWYFDRCSVKVIDNRSTFTLYLNKIILAFHCK